MRNLNAKDIGALLDPHQYIGTAVAQVERLYEKLQRLYLD
jgi:adenylosuccinate lyase